MSKIAEQKALEAYPIKEEWVGNQYGGMEDTNSLSREKYQEGYDQAMQDFLEKAMEYFKGKPIHPFWVEQFKNYIQMNKEYNSEKEQQIYDDAMEDFMEKATSILSKYFFDHNYELVSRFSNLMYGYESEN